MQKTAKNNKKNGWKRKEVVSFHEKRLVQEATNLEI